MMKKPAVSFLVNYRLFTAARLIGRDGRVNGEFYVDSAIEDALALGLEARIFEIDHYLCWGTPDELRSFEYWQSCFQKWPAHSYALEADRFVPEAAVGGLKARFRARPPPLPGPKP